MMTGLVQDLRYALRQLRMSPSFAGVAVLTLGLGIGANIAVFSFVDELWLHRMPVRNAERLVRIFTSNPSSQGEVERGYSSYPDFQDLRARSKTLSGVAALDMRGALVDDGVSNTLVTAAVVSTNFFDVIEAKPAAGHMFTESEFQNAPGLSVVLSYPFWQRQFHGDVSLPGRTIRVDSQPVLVLGVLPRGFRGADPLVVGDLWIPLPTWQQLTGERDKPTLRGFREYELFGRLREGVALRQAGAELSTIAGALGSAYPKTNSGRKMTLLPENQTRSGMAVIGLALLGIAALVLLIACANVAGLLMARAEYRRKEIATRLALGAVPGHIVRQLLTETLVLASGGTLAALIFGHIVLLVLPRLLPQSSIPIGIDAHLNSRGFLFALAAAFASLLFFGLVPALQASKAAPAGVLKQSGTQTGAGRRPLRNLLVVAQVTLSFVMIVSAGLMVRSVMKVLDLDPGFNAHQNMLVMELVPDFGTKSAQGSTAFVREAQRRLEALPGVTATTTALRLPFGMSGGGATRRGFTAQNLATGDAEGATINFDYVGDNYFAVLGTRILRGRPIVQHDLDVGARVMVTNLRMANRFWPGEDPVGKHVRLGRADGDDYEVIGVAEDGKYNDVREDQMPYMFIPMGSDEYGELALAVKTGPDPETLAPAVRRTLREINRAVPILSMVTLREHVREAVYEQRVIAGLIAALGGLGLLLATVGIYGLLSFLVARRTHEIGIRLALGARRGRVFRLVIGHALTLTGSGLAAGVVGAVLAARALHSLLFGVSATDAFAFTVAILVLVAVAFLAALAPALTATKVDPMVALRYE